MLKCAKHVGAHTHLSSDYTSPFIIICGLPLHKYVSSKTMPYFFCHRPEVFLQ